MLDLFKKITQKVEEVYKNTPPTIGVIGVSGVGKSSTLNSMFKTQLKTSDTIRCTTEFSDHLVGTTVTNGPHEGKNAVLRVIDAPGLGEDIRQDPTYLRMYKENLPQCDVILYILSARNRAVALDQQYLKDLSEFHGKMVFGINQVDLVEPMDWDFGKNMPSESQENNIQEILSDRKSRIEDIIGREIKMIPYGAKQYYRLSNLFESIIDSCPEDRLWLFQLIKGFSAKDWLDKVEGISEEEKEKILKSSINK